MEEIWKPIKNYENLYEISNLGNVRSLDRLIIGKDGRHIQYKGINLSKKLDRNLKYYTVGLTDLNKNRKIFLIHRLVAETFISNPNNLQIVNHKDENGFNNCVNNLEWATIEENNKYSLNKHPERNNINCKKIIQYDLEGNFIKVWDSLKQAQKNTGISYSTISSCLRGKSGRGGNFQWIYYEGEDFPKKINKYSSKNKTGIPYVCIPKKTNRKSPFSKKVIQYDLNGNFIKVWDGILEAERELKICNIHSCCSRLYHQAGNFVWRYFSEDFPKKIETIFKEVLQYDLNNNLLNVFPSARHAAIYINRPSNGRYITECCKGKRKTYLGFVWKFKENEI